MSEIVFSRGYKQIKLGLLHDGRHIDLKPLHRFNRRDKPLSRLYASYRKLVVATEQGETADMLGNATTLDELIDFIMTQSHLSSAVIRQFLYITIQTEIFKNHPLLRRSSMTCRSLPIFPKSLSPDQVGEISFGSGLSPRSSIDEVPNQVELINEMPNRVGSINEMPTRPRVGSINEIETRPRAISIEDRFKSLTRSFFGNPMSKSLPSLDPSTPTLIGNHRNHPSPSSSRWIPRRPSFLKTSRPIAIPSVEKNSSPEPWMAASPRTSSLSLSSSPRTSSNPRTEFQPLSSSPKTEFQPPSSSPRTSSLSLSSSPINITSSSSPVNGYLRTAIPISPDSLPKYSQSGNLIKKGSPRRKYYDLVIFERCYHENGTFNVKSACISFQKRTVSSKISDSLKWKLVIQWDDGFYVPIE